MSKIVICNITSLMSSFVLYTLAVPFFSDLTFLLPADAVLTSLCLLLLFQFSDKFYVFLCFPGHKLVTWVKFRLCLCACERMCG